MASEARLITVFEIKNFPPVFHRTRHTDGAPSRTSCASFQRFLRDILESSFSQRITFLRTIFFRTTNEVWSHHFSGFQLRSRRLLDGRAGAQTAGHVPVA